MSGEIVPDNEVIPDITQKSEQQNVQQYHTGDTVPDSEVVPDTIQKLEQQNTQKYTTGSIVPDDQVVSDKDYYGTDAQKAKAVAEGYGRGAFGPVATAFETKVLGVKPEDIARRQEINPVKSAVSETAGLFTAPLIPGVGEYTLGSVLGKVGKLAGMSAEAAGAGKILQGAARGAAELPILQASDETSKWLENAPNSVSSIGANLGLSAVLGAGFGGALSGAMPLLKASKQGVLDRSLQSFKDELNTALNPGEASTEQAINSAQPKGMLSTIAEGLQEPDSGKIAQELHSLKTDIDTGKASVFKPEYDQDGNRVSSTKDQALRSILPGPENNELAINQANKLVEQTEARLAKIKDPSMASILEDNLNRYKSNLVVAQSPIDYFYSAEDMKKSLQDLGQFNKATPLSEQPLRYAARDLSRNYRVALEDPEVFGRGADLQKNLNKALSDYIPAEKDFKAFTTKLEGNDVVDPNKIDTYTKQAGNNKADIKQNKIKNYIDASQNLKDAVNQVHINAGLEAPFKTQIPLNETMKSFNKVPNGVKLVRYLVNKGAGKLIGDVALGGLGHATGIPGAGLIGAYIGDKAVAPAINHVLPAILKKVASEPVNSEGFKAALEFGNAAIKGETKIDNTVKSLFKPSEGIIEGLTPSEKDTDKLDKRLKVAGENPQQLIDMSKNLSHYMPDHAAQLSKSITNAVTYLNSQRPDPVRANPLDPKPVVDPILKDKWSRTLGIAEKPISILNHIKTGTIQPTDVQTLQAIHPDLYNKLMSKIGIELADHTSKDLPIPYSTRMGLSLFMGQPMDSTLTPQGILAAQSVFAANQPTPQQAQPKKKASAASAKTMNNVAQSYQTPVQARAAEKSGAKA